MQPKRLVRHSGQPQHPSVRPRTPRLARPPPDAGKHSGFSVAAAAAPPNHHSDQYQYRARRPEPAELGAKAQLEAALVAAVLHMLALLPAVACGAGGAGVEGTVWPLLGRGAQLGDLQRLVRQARRELLVGNTEERRHGDLLEQAAELAAMGAARAEFGWGLFDLSQASAELTAAAACGLALLEGSGAAALHVRFRPNG